MLFENEYVPPSSPPRMELPRRADESDSALLAALRNLAPLLHPDDAVRWSAEIQLPMTLGQRFAAWRAQYKAGRHGENL